MFRLALRNSLAVLFISLFISSSFSQDLDIPASWRQPISKLSLADRKSRAKSVADSLVPLFNPTNGLVRGLSFLQASNVQCAIALHDRLSPNGTNNVINYIDIVQQLNPDFYYTSNWALASVYAYRAYKQDYLLYKATSIWDKMNEYLVTSDDAASGTHPLRTVLFNSSCTGGIILLSLITKYDLSNKLTGNAGAVLVYGDTDPQSVKVNGQATCGFMLLSAHLSELTGNTTYRDAAELSATFIKNNLYNGTVILDSIDLQSCNVTTDTLSSDSGFYIEGLTIHANLTQSQEWASFLQQFIYSTTAFPGWVRDDGVIIEGADIKNSSWNNDPILSQKGMFVRGLYEAWSRSVPGSKPANFIEAFINVQYNALVDLADSKPSGNYSPNWALSGPSQIVAGGQLVALDLLNAGLGIAQRNASDTSESPQASGQPQSQTKKVHVGAVVGPTIAGVACIAIVIATIFIYRRRRQRKRARSDNSKLDPNDVYYYNELSNSAPIGNNVETNRDIPHGGAQGPVIEPYMLTAPNPGILMEKLNNSIPLYTSQSAPGSSVPESTSMGRTTTEGSSDGGTTHPSAIPGLLQRLNEAIAQLPSSGTTAHSEADLPPGYYEEPATTPLSRGP
ncbi:hypothetical protein NLI96_g1806 [Meripilus lineatus]|uniref:Glycoside hydrolase family 76 protein n=1 Tax=Meripilus lineatus TaxID=2056292 RepID=A0AAD5VC80_9APHY|nr:hypothetical protein NLI96_g1806 [Physisporinus lineatus]